MNSATCQDVKIGDEVEVMVVEKEDREGNLHLSRKSARIFRAWERIVEVHKTGEVVTGTVTSKTKGRLDCGCIWYGNLPCQVRKLMLSLLLITTSLLVKQWSLKW